MTTWPSTLIITKENFKESPPDVVLRSKMDVGPDKLRKRSSSAVRPVTIGLFLTDADLETFDAFYLANVATSFDFTNPRTAVAGKARFAEKVPDYTPNETFWHVSVDLEILP